MTTRASLLFLVALGLAALGADWIAPHDPTRQYPGMSYGGPTLQHPLGLDDLGRDVLSRLIHGARISLAVGVLAQLMVLAIGLLVGGIAGYLGGRVDNLLMRGTDVVYAFPDLLFVIVIVTAVGPGFLSALVAIGLVSWVGLARLVRGQVLALREREHVLAARCLGASGPRIFLRHLLPNTLGPIVVAVTFGIPQVIFVEAALSFLGLGVRPPTASWGSMIERGRAALFAAPHLVISAALAISLTMLAFNLLADGLREAFDPRRASSPRSARRRGYRAAPLAEPSGGIA